MKKSGKCACERPASATSATSEKRENGDESRNRKTYLNRLEEMGLDEPPVIKRAKMPSAIELARLAATLESSSGGKASAGELTARAREIWRASANSLFVREMAEFVVRGICLFDKRDWARHCRSLIGLLDDAEGAVPGLHTTEQHVQSIRCARAKASIAVVQVWSQAERGEDVIRSLFPAKSETEQSRRKKLVGLLEFAYGKVAVPGLEAWPVKYGINVPATLIAAWMPLPIPREEAKLVETAAKAWLDFPKTVEVPNLGASPVLARWLTVLRMVQSAEAKSRS